MGSPSSKNNVALRIDDVALSQGHDCCWIFAEVLNLNFHGLWVKNVVLAQKLDKCPPSLATGFRPIVRSRVSRSEAFYPDARIGESLHPGPRVIGGATVDENDLKVRMGLVKG